MSILHVSQESVRDGKVSVSGLNLPDGETVDVVVSSATRGLRRTIAEVRGLIGQHVDRFDDPFEPLIPPESWEMLK